MPRREYRDRVATFLWEWGEDLLAERALAASPDEMSRLELIADLRFDEIDDRSSRGKLQRGKAVALAAVDVFEGAARDLARRRARYTYLTPIPEPLNERIEAEAARSMREDDGRTSRDFSPNGESVRRRSKPRPLTELEARFMDLIADWLHAEYGFSTDHKYERFCVLKRPDFELRIHLGSNPARTGETIFITPRIRLKPTASTPWTGRVDMFWFPHLSEDTFAGSLLPWVIEKTFESRGGPLESEGNVLRNQILTADTSLQLVTWTCRNLDDLLTVSAEMQNLLRRAIDEILPDTEAAESTPNA